MTFYTLHKRAFQRFAVPMLLASLYCVPASTGMALSDPEKVWKHKDWRASYSHGRCRLATGGDGDGTFEITLDERGYNADVSYLPITYSNLPPALQQGDLFSLLIDGRNSGLGPEIAYFDGMDPYDRFMVGASLTTGFVADLVDFFRQGTTATFIVSRPDEHAFAPDTFSLAGFSATYLKIVEWCHLEQGFPTP